MGAGSCCIVCGGRYMGLGQRIGVYVGVLGKVGRRRGRRVRIAGIGSREVERAMW